MKISSIKAMRNYLYENSGFSKATVNNVIRALGYPLQGSGELFTDLSCQFEDCAENGSKVVYRGFTCRIENKAFYKANRKDIINHMENMAAELGTDIISMVQCFGVFRNSTPPTASEIGKALWGSFNHKNDFTTLYNVFAWYILEEVSRTWLMFLEDNPAIRKKLSA